MPNPARSVAAGAALTAMMSLAPPVLAQDKQSETIHIALAHDLRSKATDTIVMPRGTKTITAALRFVTSRDGIGDDGLRFTDVALLDLAGRIAIAGRAELYLATTLLPKQPSYTDELVWQSSSLGGRIGFGERYAVDLTVSGGPLLGRIGYWSEADALLEARKSIHDTVVFQGAIGGSATGLFFDRDTEEAFWLTEIATDGQIVFREPSGTVAGWLGTQFRFPVASNPDPSAPDPESGLAIAPATRLNFEIGCVLSYIDDWDLFAVFSVLDRGDAENPETTLPILDGGFDQQQLMIGVTRRFSSDDEQRPAWQLATY